MKTETSTAKLAPKTMQEHDDPPKVDMATHLALNLKKGLTFYWTIYVKASDDNNEKAGMPKLIK